MNQSLLDYFTSLDAILLAGYLPKTKLQMHLFNHRGVFPEKNVDYNIEVKLPVQHDFVDNDFEYFATIPVS